MKKFTSLKTLIQSEIDEDIVFEEYYETEVGKMVAYIFLQLDKVSIHNKKTWTQVFEFFNNQMAKFELFFLEYKDFIES